MVARRAAIGGDSARRSRTSRYPTQRRLPGLIAGLDAALADRSTAAEAPRLCERLELPAAERVGLVATGLQPAK